MLGRGASKLLRFGMIEIKKWKSSSHIPDKVVEAGKILSANKTFKSLFFGKMEDN